MQKMSTVEFVEDLVIVNTCLAELSELSKTLQKRDMNVIMANGRKRPTEKINAIEKISFLFSIKSLRYPILNYESLWG